MTQFSTDIKLNNESIETVSETKLLGTIITNDLKWNKNTENIVKDTNKRMQILHKATKFTNNIRDLKQIYMLQISYLLFGIRASHKKIEMT